MAFDFTSNLGCIVSKSWYFCILGVVLADHIIPNNAFKQNHMLNLPFVP